MSYKQGPIKLFVGCPAYKWPPDPHFQMSMQALLNDKRFNAEYRAVIGDAHIERARAMVLLHYLKDRKKHGWEYFLNVDWDIEFRPDDVYRMCMKCETYGIDIIGGPYTYKTKSDGKKEQVVFRGKPGVTPDNDRGLIEADYLGGGFTMMTDKLVMEMVEKYDGELGFNANPDLDSDKFRTVAIWNPVLLDRPDWGEGAKELLSEDYSMCYRTIELGYQPYLDLNVYLKHWDGPNCYTLPAQQVEPK